MEYSNLRYSVLCALPTVTSTALNLRPDLRHYVNSHRAVNIHLNPLYRGLSLYPMSPEFLDVFMSCCLCSSLLED